LANDEKRVLANIDADCGQSGRIFVAKHKPHVRLSFDGASIQCVPPDPP
jgi:hypothetical protein